MTNYVVVASKLHSSTVYDVIDAIKLLTSHVWQKGILAWDMQKKHNCSGETTIIGTTQVKCRPRWT